MRIKFMWYFCVNGELFDFVLSFYWFVVFCMFVVIVLSVIFLKIYYEYNKIGRIIKKKMNCNVNNEYRRKLY